MRIRNDQVRANGRSISTCYLAIYGNDYQSLDKQLELDGKEQ